MILKRNCNFFYYKMENNKTFSSKILKWFFNEETVKIRLDKNSKTWINKYVYIFSGPHPDLCPVRWVHLGFGQIVRTPNWSAWTSDQSEGWSTTVLLGNPRIWLAPLSMGHSIHSRRYRLIYRFVLLLNYWWIYRFIFYWTIID